jgi:hypothetical protein
MHREWFALGTIFILVIAAWFWPQKYFRPKLGPGELLLKAAFADEESEEGTRSGRFCLTSSRLVYGIHLGYSSAIGPGGGSGRFDDIEKVEWALSSITKVEECARHPTTERVKILFRDGNECCFTFQTNTRQANWARAIEDARQARG